MRLADYIAENLESILDEWEEYAREIPSARGMEKEALRDHARQMLLAIADDLRTPQTPQEQKDKSRGRGKDAGARAESGAEKHATGRLRAGFSLNNLVSEFRALRASVLRLWGKSSSRVQQSDLDDITRFNEAVDQAVAESVARYTATVGQAQDVFLGMLGHDLRNPLGAITMSAQFLMQDRALDGKHVKAATMIHSSSKQMSRLIGDLLDFTRTRLGRGIPLSCEHGDLAELLQQTVAQACAFHPERVIELEAQDDVTGVWDPARIGQVFSNLIGNAIKHGDPNTPVRVRLRGDADSVTATIHNHGTPIPEEALPRIFDPLCQVAPDARAQPDSAGIGLGLYITREIVQAHEGTVTVSSTQERGTVFTVRLPRRCGSA